MEKIFEKLNPYMTRLANNPTLKGISSGMMGSIVVTLVGSLCLLLVVFPVEAVRNAVEALGITSILLNVNSFTIGCLALYIVVMVTNALVKSYNSQEDGIAAAVVGLMSFLIVTPIGATADKISAIPTTWLGAAGVFSAMIISIITAKIFVFVKAKGWTIKMPDSVPPMVSRTFEGLVPGMIVAVLFIVISGLFAKTSYGCMHQFVYSIIQIPLQGLGGNLWAMCIFTIAAQLLWFFGIHGTNVIAPIYTPIWLTLDLANQASVAQNGIGAAQILLKGILKHLLLGDVS
ncbi:MAG: PTS transporter subunit EIIC [Coprobacillus cateniformis]